MIGLNTLIASGGRCECRLDCLRNDRKLWMRAAAGTPIESCDWLGGGSLLNTVNKGDSLDDFVKLSIPVESTPAFLGLQA